MNHYFKNCFQLSSALTIGVSANAKSTTEQRREKDRKWETGTGMVPSQFTRENQLQSEHGLDLETFLTKSNSWTKNGSTFRIIQGNYLLSFWLERLFKKYLSTFRKLETHSSVGLPSGSLITIGGWTLVNGEDTRLAKVWLLKQNAWSRLKKLKKVRFIKNF